MNPRLIKRAVSGLQWVLGLVVLVESAHFALAPGVAQQFAKTGLPPWIPPALGGSEVLAAILFLLPAARQIGGYALLFIFAIAAAIHILHGQYDVGSLLLYAMAVIVCMTYRDKGGADAAYDR